MEDMTHLQTFTTWNEDLLGIITRFRERVNGETDKEVLLSIAAEQNEILVEWLRQQRRCIAYLRGEKVEPEIQYAEAIVHAVMGGGSG